MSGKASMRNKLSHKPKATTSIIAELKTELRRLYGERLLKLILYGSYARSEASSESDIDLAVLLEGTVAPVREIDRMLDIITGINLKHNVLISVYPVSTEALHSVRSPLLMNIRKEGVTV